MRLQKLNIKRRFCQDLEWWEPPEELGSREPQREAESGQPRQKFERREPPKNFESNSLGRVIRRTKYLWRAEG